MKKKTFNQFFKEYLFVKNFNEPLVDKILKMSKINNMKTKEQQVSLILNIIIITLTIIGSIFCFAEIYIIDTKPIEHGIKLFKFFTVQSNVLAGITSFIYVIYLLRQHKTDKEIPLWVSILRYMATIDLVITFLVVALFLGFIVEEGYFSLYVNANFFYHLAIPVINFISFVFYENKFQLGKKQIALGMTHIMLYAVFYLIVAFSHFQDGKVSLEYDWYGFAQSGVLGAIISGLVVLGLGYLISFVLYKIINKSNQSKKSQ